MITRVRLENWKAYNTFDIRLQPGTTFLVAANGVGKTSFIEAVQWALAQDAAPKKIYMRRGANTASAEVQLAIDDGEITVKRSLIAGRGKTPKMKLEARVDGVEVHPDVVFDRLAEAWRADSGFVLRAAFLTERFVDHDPDLRAHLTKLHSLDHVQAAISLLEPAARKAAAEADEARKGAAATAEGLDAARVDAQQAAAIAEQAVAEAERLRGRVTAAEQALQDARRVVAMREGHDEWIRRRAELVADVERTVGPVPEGVPALVFVRSAEAGATRQLLERTEQRARSTERIAAIEEALGRLRQSGGECPVCRRPLDDESRAHAERQHLHDHNTVVAAMEEIDLGAHTGLVSRLRGLAERAEALGGEPELPEDVVIDVDGLVRLAAEASAAFEHALGEAGRVRQAAMTAQQVLDEREEAARPSPAVALYARAAAFEASRAALEAAITEVLEVQLGPVSEEVNRRWEAVFPDRPGLRLDQNGRIVRTFDDDEDDLDFSSFSTGERVVSKLLLRLATLTATTSVPFCWIDEPLEHLDPDARRYVARTLAFLSSTADLRQIFVTTYEEELALRLRAEAPDDVHLVFLHTAPVAA